MTVPRYFFHIAHHRTEPDDEGTELDSPERARVEAVTFAGAYLRDNPHLLENEQLFRVDVTDESGRRVMTIEVRSETP